MAPARSSTHFWLMVLLAVKTHGVDLDITLTGEPLTGSVITLTCNIPSFTQAALWKNSVLSNGAIQSCTFGFCVSTSPSYPGYTFSSNVSAFTVVIASADLDDNVWTCEHDSAADSGTITLNLKVAPTTCTLVKSGDTYTCTSSCGYPVGDMSIRAKLNGTSKTQDLTSLTAVSTPACTSPESAYSANVPTSFFTQSADLYCECGVSGIESTFVQSNALAVTGPTTTTIPTTTTTTPTTTTTLTTTISARFTDEELGAIIGGTVGGVCLLIIIIGLAVFHYYRVQKKGSVKTDDKRGNQRVGRDRRDKPSRGDKPPRGDNPWAPVEKEKVVEYHNGQAYLVEPRHYKDPRSHGYHNRGFDPEHHRREMRPHHNIGRTKSNGHYISSQSYYTGQRSHSSQGYSGERSGGHYGSSKIYRGQSSVLQVYQPEDFPQFYTDQHFSGGQDGYGGYSHASYENDPRPGRGDNHTLMYY